MPPVGGSCPATTLRSKRTSARHGSLVRRSDQGCELGGDAVPVARLRLAPKASASRDLFIRNVDLQQLPMGTDGDLVAVPDECDCFAVTLPAGLPF